jgi:hypothetical protein
VAPRATSSSITRSVTARQWHTYTPARLREPNLAVKSAGRGRAHSWRSPARRRLRWQDDAAADRPGQGAAVVGAAVVLVAAGTSVMVTFFTVTFLVGGPSPLAGARSEIFWATSRPWVTVPRNA